MAGQELDRALVDLEQEHGARLGLVVLDTGSGRRLVHRASERFAFASTIKVFIAAATLQTATDQDLKTVVRYSADDVLEYAPVTRQHVQEGMTVGALIDAMLRYSDNTAANLLVQRLGGPAAVETFLRSIGDGTTTVDRVEPDLNSAIPGDRRDTTTPAAFSRSLEAVLLGDVLPSERRQQLEAIMRGNTTGDAAIRAGVPGSWVVADKTGSGAWGTRNDVAVLRPPHRAPVLVVLLSDRGSASAPSQDALLEDATRAALDALGPAAP